MTKGTFRIVTVVAVVALVGALSLTVTISGDDSEGRGGSFMRYLHEMGRHLHGANHHQNPMAGLIEELELNPDQLQRLEKIHKTFGTFGQEDPRAMIDLHNRLIEQFEQGKVETGEIRHVIDGHLDQIREMAYGVTDELISLVNGLDARQREVLLTHIRDKHDGDNVHHGHGSGH